MNSVNAGANIDVHVYQNWGALSSVSIEDLSAGSVRYYHRDRGGHMEWNFCQGLPDSCKEHTILIIFSHNLANQGPDDYVTVPYVTDGEVDVDFQTYGDDVHGYYKNRGNTGPPDAKYYFWKDKKENHFYLG